MMIQSLRLAGIRTRAGIISLLLAVQLILAFVAALTLQRFAGSAAPGSTISACVNPYTGGVRMGPTGATTCNANETKVSWPAVDTDTDTHGVGEMTTQAGSYSVPAMSTAVHILDCPEGYVATGGGFSNSTLDAGDVVLRASFPTSTGDGWHIEIHNPHSVAELVGVYLRCALP